MKFILSMNCDNYAFFEAPDQEVARILRDLANRMDSGTTFSLRDINGNKVGTAEFTGEEDEELNHLIDERREYE